MDQEAIYDPGHFDHASVDLEKTPSSVDEYMKQVIVSRERCAAVTKATTLVEIKQHKAVIPHDVSKDALCVHAPGKEWCQAKSDNFDHIRQFFAQQRDQHVYSTKIKLPLVNDQIKWINFCLEERHPDVKICPSQEAQFAHHKGTPPSLSLLLTFSDRINNTLIEHLLSHFSTQGYSRSLFEWIFSVMVTLRKPLLHDVVSALRNFARSCRLERAKLTKKDEVLIREYSLFIALISIHFGQKDLSDEYNK